MAGRAEILSPQPFSYPGSLKGLRIGLAKDAAFSFTYEVSLDEYYDNIGLILSFTDSTGTVVAQGINMTSATASGTIDTGLRPSTQYIVEAYYPGTAGNITSASATVTTGALTADLITSASATSITYSASLNAYEDGMGASVVLKDSGGSVVDSAEITVNPYSGEFTGLSPNSEYTVNVYCTTYSADPLGTAVQMTNDISGEFTISNVTPRSADFEFVLDAYDSTEMKVIVFQTAGTNVYEQEITAQTTTGTATGLIGEQTYTIQAVRTSTGDVLGSSTFTTEAGFSAEVSTFTTPYTIGAEVTIHGYNDSASISIALYDSQDTHISSFEQSAETDTFIFDSLDYGAQYRLDIVDADAGEVLYSGEVWTATVTGEIDVYRTVGGILGYTVVYNAF